ncbi:NAD-dependent epimerase/dehydratase family protein [Sphingomonas sp. PB4P5]|uniref:NAD-dependent epimerase/dehydratase family protein n=1 Tax=Parasphingomonas puruogangriensis TaxID=3096155 RepID=UPI002FCA6CCA
MRVLVTGAGGFVGRAVIRRLASEHVVIATTDRSLPPGVDGIEGDLADPILQVRLLALQCDAIVHLATIPGGAAEADPARAWAVNVDVARVLADGAAAGRTASGAPVRFVFASSIAVLGDTLPTGGIDDTAPLAPSMLYGGHKALVETWLSVLSRRGELSALALRLPGIVARPNDGAGLKSAFMSDLFHAIRAGRRCELPVGPDATMWLMSAGRAADNIGHALLLPHPALPSSPAITLPALRVRMDDLVAAIEDHAGRAAQIDYAPDPDIERGFGRLPPLVAGAARSLGFSDDGDIGSLVRNAYGDEL